MCFVFGHTALYEGKTMLYLYTVKLDVLDWMQYTIAACYMFFFAKADIQTANSRQFADLL